MSSMQKLLRERFRIAEGFGLTVVSYEKTGSNHVRMRLRALNGNETLLFMAATPGDGRAEKNNHAAIKRFARENSPITEAVAAAMRDNLVEPQTTNTDTNMNTDTNTHTDTQNESTARKERHQLVQEEVVTLYLWVRENLPEETQETYTEIAKRASEALTLEISPDNVSRAMKFCGKRTKPRAESDPTRPKDRVLHLAREIRTLRIELKGLVAAPGAQLLALCGQKPEGGAE